MAFPTVNDADTTNGTITSNSGSWTLTYPSNIAAGDLLLLFIGVDGNVTSPTLPAGWEAYRQDGTAAVTMVIAAKIADGSETGTFTYTVGANEQGGWRIRRISGWFGSGIPTGADFGDTTGVLDGAGFMVSLSDFGSSASPRDPGASGNPSNWDVEDTLWFSVLALDTSRTISGYPSNFATDNVSDVSGGAGGATIASCRTNSATTTVDANAWSFSNTDDFVHMYVAVRPAAQVPTAPHRRFSCAVRQAVNRGATYFRRHDGILVPRRRLWVPA